MELIRDLAHCSFVTSMNSGTAQGQKAGHFNLSMEPVMLTCYQQTADIRSVESDR
jgi:hypothetical protein